MHQPLDELLAEALRRQAGPERDTWMASACGTDEQLRRELYELIEASESMPASFLTRDVEGDGEPPTAAGRRGRQSEA